MTEEYEYRIYLDGEEVWRGQDHEGKTDKILEENPDLEVAIEWVPKKEETFIGQV